MLSVRERRRTDLATVVGWIPDAHALYLFTGPRLTWPLTPEQLADMELLDGLTAWMVENEDATPVGHFDITLSGRAAGLGRVVIDPAERGRGHARGLVRLAIERARALGAEELALNAITGNTAAIRTYERAGFIPSLSAPRPDVLRMTLRL